MDTMSFEEAEENDDEDDEKEDIHQGIQSLVVEVDHEDILLHADRHHKDSVDVLVHPDKVNIHAEVLHTIQVEEVFPHIPFPCCVGDSCSYEVEAHRVVVVRKESDRLE